MNDHCCWIAFLLPQWKTRNCLSVMQRQFRNEAATWLLSWASHSSCKKKCEWLIITSYFIYTLDTGSTLPLQWRRWRNQSTASPRLGQVEYTLAFEFFFHSFICLPLKLLFKGFQNLSKWKRQFCYHEALTQWLNFMHIKITWKAC
jgi:hypothetical protein